MIILSIPIRLHETKIIYMLDYGVSQDFIYRLGWELRRYNYILIPMTPKDLASHLGKNKTRFPIHLISLKVKTTF